MFVILYLASTLSKYRYPKSKKKYMKIEKLYNLSKVTSKDAATFEDLIAHLSVPINPTLYPQTCLVRALIVWLAMQDVKPTKYKPADIDSPLGVIQNLRNKTLSFTEAFVLICR